MTRSVTYEVGVTFCNDRSFAHEHTSLASATEEYSEMLAVAIDPSLLTSPDAKHIRMVTFLAKDELGIVTQHINSPVFECEDRVVA